MTRARAGFTLLEVLVATLLMGVAVAGVIGGLRVSISNEARVIERDRAAALGRRQMDELLAMPRLPLMTELRGEFDPQTTGGVVAGWRAMAVPFEGNRGVGGPASAAVRSLVRIQLEIWWKSGGMEKKAQLSAYRGEMLPDGVPTMAGRVSQ